MANGHTNDGEDVIPEFAIEIISETDNIIKVEAKVTEYFKAGVKVLWHIFPNEKVVYIYTGGKEVKIYSDTDVLSALPVLNGFELTVNELFMD